MSKPVRILGIPGSLRRESYNRAALRAATQLVPEGATIDIFELEGNAQERFDSQGNLTDDATKEFIRQLLQNLVEWTKRIRPESGNVENHAQSAHD